MPNGSITRYTGSMLLGASRTMGTSVVVAPIGANHIYAVFPNSATPTGAGDIEAFAIFDVSNPQTPVYVPGPGFLSLFDLLGDPANEVDQVTQGNQPVVVGNYMYMSGGGSPGWLQIWNVSDPANPTYVTSQQVLGAASTGPVGLTTDGTYLYMRSYDDGHFEIYDLVDPEAPAQVGALTDTTNLDAYGSNNPVIFGDGYAYLNELGSNVNVTDSCIAIVDIDPIGTPTYVSEVLIDGGSQQRNHCTASYDTGSNRYILTGAAGKMLVYEVTSPGALSLVGTFTDASLSGAPNAIITDHWPNVYMVDQTGKVWPIDLTDPSAPTSGGHVQITKDGGIEEWTYLGTRKNVLTAFLAGNYLHVLIPQDGLPELFTFDVSTPSSPTADNQQAFGYDLHDDHGAVIGSYYYWLGKKGPPDHFVIRYALLEDVLNADFGSITPVGELVLGDLAIGSAYFAVRANRLVFSFDTTGSDAPGGAWVWIYDVTDPANPVFERNVSTGAGSSGGGYFLHLTHEGKYLFSEPQYEGLDGRDLIVVDCDTGAASMTSARDELDEVPDDNTIWWKDPWKANLSGAADVANQRDYLVIFGVNKLDGNVNNVGFALIEITGGVWTYLGGGFDENNPNSSQLDDVGVELDVKNMVIYAHTQDQDHATFLRWDASDIPGQGIVFKGAFSVPDVLGAYYPYVMLAPEGGNRLWAVSSDRVTDGTLCVAHIFDTSPEPASAPTYIGSIEAPAPHFDEVILSAYTRYSRDLFSATGRTAYWHSDRTLLEAKEFSGAVVAWVHPADTQYVWGGIERILQVSATLSGEASSLTSIDIKRGGISLGTPTFNATSGFYELSYTPPDAENLGETYTVDAQADVGDPASASITVNEIPNGSPEAIVEQPGYTGAVGDVRDDPDVPDANWITQDDNGATPGVSRFSFPHPYVPLDEAADAQGFRLWIRKQGLAGDPDPTITVDLYENGSLVRQLANQVVTNLTGEMIAVTWTATELIDTSGEDAELRIAADRGVTSGGGPETFRPDSVLTATNYTASGATAAALIDDDPDASEGDWLTASGNDLDTTLRVGFPTPPNNPATGADLQEFRIRVRANNIIDCSMTVEVQDGGVTVATLGTDLPVTSTPEVFSFTWDAVNLNIADGRDVQVYIQGFGSGGGKGSDRSSLDVDAVEWNAEIATYDDYPSGVDLGAVEWQLAEGATAPEIQATGAVTLGSLSVSGAGTNVAQTWNATGAVTLSPLTASATGTAVAPSFSATGAVTLGSLQAAATATNEPKTWNATGDVTLSPLAVSGAGAVESPTFEATGAVSLSSLAVAGAATMDAPEVQATGAVTLGSLQVAGAGTVALPSVEGIGDVALSPLVVSGAAAHEPPTFAATGAVTLGALTVNGVGTIGTPEIQATGAVTLGSLAVAGAATADAPQRGRPTRTTQNKAWTNELGETEDLHLSVDEETVDYGDYAESAVPSGDNKFGTGFTMLVPITSTDHAILVEAAKIPGDAGKTIDLVVTLLEAGTEIATWTEPDLPTTPALYTFSLTALEADAIGDYTNLEVTYQAIESGSGSAAGGRVYWVAFEVPPPQEGTGAGYIALSPLSVSAAGTVEAPIFEGTADVTLSPLVVDAQGATGTPEIQATADVTLGALTVAATATHEPPEYVATGGVTLGSLGVSGTGQQVAAGFIGSAAVTLSPLSVAASATTTVPSYEATGAVTLNPLAVEADATHVAPGIAGAGEVSLSPLAVAGTATFEIPDRAGQGELTLGTLVVTATATQVPPGIVGTGTITLGVLAVEAVGAQNYDPSLIYPRSPNAPHYNPHDPKSGHKGPTSLAMRRKGGSSPS